MKKKLWVITMFLILFLFSGHISLAQNPTPTPIIPTSTPTPGTDRRLNAVEGKIDVLEQKQEVLLRASETRIEQLQTLLNWLGIVFVVLSVIFGGVAAVATWLQIRQQGTNIESSKHVSEVLDVTHKILESRLLKLSEEEGTIDQLTADLSRVADFVEGIREGIRHQRELLENGARKLSQTQRHDFKRTDNIEALNNFARDFDRFKWLYPKEEELNGQCLYIRGVAAVFNDELEILQNCLDKVITQEHPDKDENQLSYDKRLANAYYYLGLNYSNLGESKDAIRLLERAHNHDPEGTDFLTQLVMAEVYTMSDQYDKAKDYLQEVEKGLKNLERTYGRLLHHQSRILSRAYLMWANVAIIERSEGWQEQAKQYAEEACKISPDYYYASFTLGQLAREITEGKDTEQIQEFFSDAYSRIQEAGHLHFVTETRIRILLLMVLALCGRHGRMVDERTVNSYLDEARLLRDDLPRIGNRICTVFSPLSKRNVDTNTISSHIDKIREGSWSLHPE